MSSESQEPPQQPAHRWRARASLAWPQIRAALILFHFAAVVVTCLPPAHKMLKKDRWHGAKVEAKFAAWAERLGKVGIETSPTGLHKWVRARTETYGRLRDFVGGWFQPYTDPLYLHQGWSLFSKPQRRPVLIQIDLRRGSEEWEPIYETRSSTLDWRARMFDNNRLRKLVGRIGRRQNRHLFTALSSWIARLVALEFDDVSDIRVRVIRFRTAKPGTYDAAAVHKTRAIEVERVIKLQAVREKIDARALGSER